MKAVAIKGKREFKIVDIDEPVKDGENVIIEILKTGICGSDIHYWDLGMPEGLVMGHEFCGRVIDPGSRSDLKVGDKVTALPISPCNECEACHTGNPQYCALTWSKAIGLSLDNPGGLTSVIKSRPDMVIKVDEKVDEKKIAMVEPIAVSLHAVNLANIKIGDKVLVVGGGIIGLGCAMLAKKNGASLVAVSETNPLRGKKGVSLGVCDTWYDAKKEGINEILRKEDFDVVIDCSGSSPAVTTAINVVKQGGTVVLVGVSMEPIRIPSVNAVMKELTMQGAIAYTKEEFETTIDMISHDEIDVLKFVSDVVSLDDVQASYERLTSGKDDAIKIIVDPKL